jgi:hypothetical protein
MPQYDPEKSLFAAYNRTELYQTCMRVGIKVRPNEPREAMIAYLEGYEEPPELPDTDHVIHAWRWGLIGFVDDNWEKLATQLICPMKNLKHPTNPNPKPCFGCNDTQVITCVVSNRHNAEKIKTFRLRRKGE